MIRATGVGLVPVLTLLLTVAACGGGGGAASAAPASGGAAAGAPGAPTTTPDSPASPAGGEGTSGAPASGSTTDPSGAPSSGGTGTPGTTGTDTSGSGGTGAPGSGGTGTSGSGGASPPLSFVRPRHRAIWIGDSLAARGWGPGGTVATAATVGFVVSGGPANPVATITTTTSHALMPGNYVQIFNEGDPTAGAALNGAVVPVLTTPSLTQFTVSATYGGQTMPNGDYSAGYQQQPWFVSSMNQATDESWLHWLNQYMDGYFTVVASYAQGGTTSTLGVTLLPKIQAGPKAEYAFIQYCTNDVNAGSPGPVQCLANIKTIVAAIEAMGMVPILCTPPALGDPAAPLDPATTTKAAQLQQILAGEQALAQSDPNLILLDTYSATVTPSDPAGHFLPHFAPVDGIHLSSYGEARMAQSLATYLSTLLPITDTLPGSTNEPSVNILPTGSMAGTNGSILSTATNVVNGTAPTGWLARGTGGTATGSLSIFVSGNNTHTGTPGFTLDITAQSGSSGQGFIVSSNGTGGSSFAGQLIPGNWYQCGFQLGAVTDLTNLNLSGQVFLNFGGGNAVSVYFMMNNNFHYENGTPLAGGTALRFISQPFYLAQVPTSGAYLFIAGVLTGEAGGQQLSLSRAFCRAVPNPYD